MEGQQVAVARTSERGEHLSLLLRSHSNESAVWHGGVSLTHGYVAISSVRSEHLAVPILYVIGGMTDRSNRDPQRSSMSGVVMPLPERARTVARALSSHVQDWAARRGAICI